MQNIKKIKEKIRKSIIDKLRPINEVVSVTFVGSFELSMSIDLISDIDIIVIVKKLNKEIFELIECETSKIQGTDIDLVDHKIKLNLSFGPLKFNDSKTVVFHIMIYDIEGHRKHVLESPFTCLDWELSKACLGKNLKDIYSSKGVQISDLILSRRGLNNYIKDLKNQNISFRNYCFKKSKITEVKKNFSIDKKHQKEYAFHIVKFLKLNLLKIINQENKHYSIDELVKEFNDLDNSFKFYGDFLKKLYNWKYENGNEPENIFDNTEQFIKHISNWIDKLDPCKVSFYRHCKTEFNDGSFLGQGRNPGILKDVIKIENKIFENIYTSKLKRTIETGNLFRSKRRIKDALLNEINYGLAEGMNLKSFKKKHKDIVNQWEKKNDPKFPEGESQLDVLERLNVFLEKYKNNLNNSLIITHNVVLRALIGQLYNIPVHLWYKININHFEKLDFLIVNKKLIPSFSSKQRSKIKDDVVSYNL